MAEEVYLKISKEMAEEHNIITGQMFGKPCIKTPNNKAFSAFYQKEMVFKLGQSLVSNYKNKYPGSHNWDPSGKNRPMKDWLQVPAEHIDEWKSMALEAFNYVEKNS